MSEQLPVTGQLSERLKKLTFLVDPENQPHQGYSIDAWRELSITAAKLERWVANHMTVCIHEVDLSERCTWCEFEAEIGETDTRARLLLDSTPAGYSVLLPD